MSGGKHLQMLPECVQLTAYLGEGRGERIVIVASMSVSFTVNEGLGETGGEVMIV